MIMLWNSSPPPVFHSSDCTLEEEYGTNEAVLLLFLFKRKILTPLRRYACQCTG